MSRYICLSPRSCCTTVRHALSFSQHHLRHASVSFTPGSQPIHADDGSAHISRSSFASSAPSTSQLCIKDHFMTGLESRYASRRNQIPIASAIANPLLPFPTPSWGKGGPAHRAAFPNQPSQSVRQPFRPSSGLLSANSGGGHEPSSGRMRLAPRRQLGERYIHHFTQGDLKQLLPDMMELGLRAGDHGEYLVVRTHSLGS